MTSRCWRCTHYQSDLKCAAFPLGIPEPLLLGEHLHETGYRGDKGYRYEPSPRFRELPGRGDSEESADGEDEHAFD